MIFFNWVGIGIIIVAAILGTIIGGKSGILVAGITMAIADLIYRNSRKNSDESIPLFHPKRGGNLMFVPVWIVGAVVFFIGIAS